MNWNFSLNLKWISYGFISCILFVLFISIHSILKTHLRKATLQDFCYQSMKCGNESYYWQQSLQCSLILLFLIFIRKIYLLNYSILFRLFVSSVIFGFAITILLHLPVLFAQLYPYFSFLLAVLFVYLLSIAALDVSYTIQTYSLYFAAKSNTMKYLMTGLMAFLALYVVAWDVAVYNEARHILIFIPLGIQLLMMILPYFFSCCCMEVYTFGIIVPTMLALYSDHFISYLPWNYSTTSKNHQSTHSFSFLLIIFLFCYSLYIHYRKKHSIFDSFANFLLHYLPVQFKSSFSSPNVSLLKSEESIEMLEKSRLQDEKHSSYYDTMTTIHTPTKSKSLVNHNHSSPEQETVLVEENLEMMNRNELQNRENVVVDEEEEDTTEINPFLEDDNVEDNAVVNGLSVGSASSTSGLPSTSFPPSRSRRRFEFDNITFFLFILLGFVAYYPWIATGDFQLRTQLTSTSIVLGMKNWKISLIFLQWGSVWIIYFCSLFHRHRVYQHYLEHKQRLYRRHILKRPDDELSLSNQQVHQQQQEQPRQQQLPYLPSIV